MLRLVFDTAALRSRQGIADHSCFFISAGAKFVYENNEAAISSHGRPASIGDFGFAGVVVFHRPDGLLRARREFRFFD
jgi:hypothetical protein